MTALLVGAVLVAGAASAVATISRPGPTALTTAVLRYGIVGYLAAALTAVAACVALVYPGVRIPILSGAIVAGAAALTSTQWLRRARIRCIWPSAARSAGLARHDRRGSQWPFDSTLTIGDEAVEWLPVIWWGRKLPDGRGVRWRLIPARGGTIEQVRDQAEALAGALRVAAVRVERTRPYAGTLTVLWQPSFDRPVSPGGAS